MDSLETGTLYLFADWPADDVPSVAAGVYTVWKGDEFIYVGMAGRGWTQSDVARKRAIGERRKGLWERLNSHASGRRSGDQFCVYICDRFIVPFLSDNERGALASGNLSLDQLTRSLIREVLSFRFVEVESGRAALELEKSVQRGSLSAGMPLLNPG